MLGLRAWSPSDRLHLVLFDFNSLLHFNAGGRRHVRKFVSIAIVEVSVLRFVVVIMRWPSYKRSRWQDIGRCLFFMSSASAASAATGATCISAKYASEETPQGRKDNKSNNDAPHYEWNSLCTGGSASGHREARGDPDSLANTLLHACGSSLAQTQRSGKGRANTYICRKM
jgi:hypothetical protein